jgi:hypothetical protein
MSTVSGVHLEFKESESQIDLPLDSDARVQTDGILTNPAYNGISQDPKVEILGQSRLTV